MKWVPYLPILLSLTACSTPVGSVRTPPAARGNVVDKSLGVSLEIPPQPEDRRAQYTEHGHGSGSPKKVEDIAVIKTVLTANTPMAGLGPKDAQATNAAFVNDRWDEIRLGVSVSPEVAAAFVVGRVRIVRWTGDARTADVLRELSAPTYDAPSVQWPGLLPRRFRARYVRDLATSDQDELRRVWENRVTAALSSASFEVLEGDLAEALRGQGIRVHYLLVGRENTAEMGRKDVIACYVTDEGGRVIAKLRHRYASEYPLGFVDTVGWPYEFLL